jgi:hypothetical protein
LFEESTYKSKIQTTKHYMCKIILLTTCAGLMACSATIANAVPVTFQVNMDYQISQSAFNPSTGSVEARGPVTGWGPGLLLTNVPGTTLYQNTVEYTGSAGSRNEYKFWHNGSGTGSVWESDPNRYFILSDSAQTVSRYFEDTWAGGPPIPVTFQVNMGVRMANGTFDPSIHQVEVRGAFQGWTGGSTLTNSPANTNIFTGTFDITTVPPGSFIKYKFYANGWESGADRLAFMPNSAAALPVVYFNNETPTAIPVTFQVDMSFAPGFDPDTDTVEARGTFQTPNTWSSGFTLTNAPGSFIYSGTTNVPHLPGTVEEYKFTFVDPAFNVSWESIGNRSFILADTAQVLPLAMFNDFSNTNDVLQVDTYVTFSVDMSSATNTSLHNREIPFDPATMSVFINGDFLNWWDWNSPPAQYQMIETYPGSLIYTNTILVPRGYLVALTYKYAADTYMVDGNSNTDTEAPFGQNHVRYVRTVGGTTVLPMDTFGVMEVEPLVGSVSISEPSGGFVTISWRGRPGVHLETSSDLATWSEVPGTYGESSVQLPVSSGARYYRLVKP